MGRGVESFGYYTGMLAYDLRSVIPILTVRRVLDGSIMKSTSPSHTYFSSSKFPRPVRKMSRTDSRVGDQSIMFPQANKYNGFLLTASI